jgi:hypothetical protein
MTLQRLNRVPVSFGNGSRYRCNGLVLCARSVRAVGLQRLCVPEPCTSVSSTILVLISIMTSASSRWTRSSRPSSAIRSSNSSEATTTVARLGYAGSRRRSSRSLRNETRASARVRTPSRRCRTRSVRTRSTVQVYLQLGRETMMSVSFLILYHVLTRVLGCWRQQALLLFVPSVSRAARPEAYGNARPNHALDTATRHQ